MWLVSQKSNDVELRLRTLLYLVIEFFQFNSSLMILGAEESRMTSAEIEWNFNSGLYVVKRSLVLWATLRDTSKIQTTTNSLIT